MSVLMTTGDAKRAGWESRVGLRLHQGPPLSEFKSAWGVQKPNKDV